MGLAGKNTLECIKELLPNFAASGLWEPLVGFFGQAAPVVAAAGTAVAAGGAIPATVGLACVGALFGLKYVGSTNAEKIELDEADERRGMVLALETIRKGTKTAEAELAELGYQLKYGFLDANIYLTRMDDAIQSISDRINQQNAQALTEDALSRILQDFFSEQTDRFDDLCFLLQNSHQDLRELNVLKSLPQQVNVLVADISACRGQLQSIKDDTNVLRVETLRLGAMLAELLESSRRENLSDEIRERKIREQIEREYEDKFTQDRDSNESAELVAGAVIDVSEVPGIEERLRERGGEAIIEALLEKLEKPMQSMVDIHRRIVSWALLVGNMQQAQKSLRFILNAFPEDIWSINKEGHVLKIQGDLEGAERKYNMVLQLSSDEYWRSAAFNNLGIIARNRCDFIVANRFFNLALTINKENKNLKGQADQYGNLGIVSDYLGDFAKAEAYLLESLEINKKINRPDRQANQLANLGALATSTNNLLKAREYFEQAVKIYQETGNSEGQAVVFGNLGTLECQLGDLNKAEEFHVKSLKINETMGRTEGIATAYGRMGLIQLRKGDYLKARQYLLYALEMNSKNGRIEAQAVSLANLGDVEQLMGNHEKAVIFWLKSIGLYKTIGMDYQLKMLLEKIYAV